MSQSENQKTADTSNQVDSKNNLIKILQERGMSQQEIDGVFQTMAKASETGIKNAINDRVKAGVDRAFEKFHEEREEKFQEAKPQQLRIAGTRIWNVWVLALLGPLGNIITAINMRSWLIGGLTFLSYAIATVDTENFENFQAEDPDSSIPIVLSLSVAGIASSQIKKNRRILGDSDGSKSRKKLKS